MSSTPTSQMMLISVVVAYLVIVTSSATAVQGTDQCLPTPYPCNTSYTNFVFPNTFNMADINEAQAALMEELASIGFSGSCGDLPRAVLCNLFFPVCTVLEDPIPICSDACQTLQTGFAVTDRIKNLVCGSFPASGLCVGVFN